MIERRFFTKVGGFEESKFLEYREDGRRFSHKKDGQITEFPGDGRRDAEGPNGEHISHTLSAITDRLKRGVWIELTLAEALPGDAPKTTCEEAW